MKILAALSTDFHWLQRRAGCVLAPLATAIKAVDGFGQIRGMVAYENWAPNSVQLHMATSAPIAWRSLLGPALSYPFLENGVGVCIGIIPSGKTQSLRFAKSVGFTEMHRVKDGWAQGEDLVILELRKEEWMRGRWAVGRPATDAPGRERHGSRTRRVLANERRAVYG